MVTSNSSDELSFPLYHGTSTLFLERILEVGLGGANPIADWKVIEFANEIHPLVVEHLSDDIEFKQRIASFGRMTRQESAAWNFQHGDTYASASREVAIRYAVNKRYGSEILTYTLDFLQGLLRHNVPGVADQLFRRYPHIFRMLDVSPAPLLIRLVNLQASGLVTEHGESPVSALKLIRDTIDESPDYWEDLVQSENFRLTKAVSPNSLAVWLINVTEWHPIAPRYTLYPLGI